MPFLLRTVEPVHVSRGTLPERFPVQNELEASANGTLSNIIRQLSSLSHHAEEVFLDLIKVGSEIASRASNLQARIDRLAVRVNVIDSVQDESSMQESLHTKPFSSSLNFNQQVVSRQSLPPAMEKKFNLCDKPPPLDKLNVYRDDGKDGLKFYTDPSYFFDLWRQEMLKDTERVIDKNKKEKPHKLKNDGQNRHKKRVRVPHNTRERQRHIAMEQGEVIMTPPNQKLSNSPIDTRDSLSMSSNSRRSEQFVRTPTAEYDGNTHQIDYRYNMASMEQYEHQQRNYISDIDEQRYGSPSYNRNGSKSIVMNGYRPSQPPPAPPSNDIYMPNNGIQNNGQPNMPRMSNTRSTPRDMVKVSRTTLPPPPPLPTEEDQVVDQSNMFPPPLDEESYDHHGQAMLAHDDLPLPPPPDIPNDDVFSNNNIAAPPPPPPPPNVPVNMNQQPVYNGEMNKPKSNMMHHKPAPVVRDGRSELLKAIRDGIELRKVETKNDVRADEKPSSYHDVASILARRVAVEMSDSESGSSDDDSDGWDETSA